MTLGWLNLNYYEYSLLAVHCDIASLVILQSVCVYAYEQRIYTMEHRPRGRALVISNRFFLKAELLSRDGAEFDEINISNLFRQLHFEVQLYLNKSASVRVRCCVLDL